jgi:flagellar biosynthesis/type III secretory pathway ATPase
MTRESTNNLIDILVIGDIDKENFNLFLTKHFFGRKIKYAVISEKEFQERLKFGDKLIGRILNQPGNVILKDSM